MASVVAFFLMASGYTMLEEENSENQWVPKNHPYIKNDAWLRMNKPKSKVRINEKRFRAFIIKSTTFRSGTTR